MLDIGLKSLARRGLQRLPFNVLYEMFYQSGRALGVTSYETSGDAGRFTGPLADQSVIKQYLRHGSFSAPIAKLFQDFFNERDGGTFYDLGANIGLVTVPVARHPRVQCVSFEPDPANFALLRANVLRNCANANVTLINAAVAETRGKLGFTRSEYNSGDHRLSPDGSLQVDAVPLDDHPPATLPLAVKIDCQGAEPSIIAGGAKTLAQADLIVCEFWPWGMRRMGLSPEPILRFATDHFATAKVQHHDAPPAPPLPMQDALAELHQLIDDGTQYAQADLILGRF